MICTWCAAAADRCDMTLHGSCKGCDCHHKPTEEAKAKERMRRAVQKLKEAVQKLKEEVRGQFYGSDDNAPGRP